MRKVKLLHFIYNLNQGGAETLVKDYALLLDKEKFDVVVLCHDRVGSPYENMLSNAGIRILYVSDYMFLTKIYFIPLIHKIICHSYVDKFIIKHIIHQENPDIIHSHLLCNSFIKFANVPDTCKLFYTVHNEPKVYWLSPKRYNKRDFRNCYYLVKERSMQLIALNEPMRIELNEMFHVNNTVVLNNGIDFKKFEIGDSKDLIRKDLGVKKDCFLVGHVGRFVEQKNHTFIIDIFNELCKKRNNAHLLLVGTGNLRPMIELKIKKMRLENYVTILERRTDIPRIMKSLDVFVFPSLYEGLGIVLIEAQKMGVPCVISEAIPHAAVVSNLVFRMQKDSTPKQWAEQLIDAKVAELKYFGMEKWDMNIVVKQLEELYLKTCLES